MGMKKYISILFILAAAAGCKKDTQTQVATGLTGKWELTQEVGGFAPTKIYTPGTGNSLQFSADSTFVQYQNAKVVRQGSYSVVKNGITFAGTTFDALYVNHKLWDMMQLKTDTLVIGSSAADGLEDTYVRDN
jgi:hypothetical protein